MTEAEFPEALRKRMVELGVDVSEVAKQMQVAPSTVKRWLEGSSCPLLRVRDEVIRKLVTPSL